MLYFIIGIVDITLSLVFQTQLNSVFFTIFLSTNISETREFLEFYSSSKIALCLFAFILSSLFFCLPKRLFSPLYTPLHTPILTQNFARSLALSLLILGSIIAGYKFYIVSASQLTPFLTDKNSALRWYFTITHSFFTQHSFIKEYQSIAQNLNANTFQDEILRDRDIPNIALIIGESTQRGLMSLYGYPLHNTPKLEALLDRGDLIVFDDVISPAGSTNESLQKVLTFSNYENSQTPWFKQQNLIDILHLAGYKTHWLSNQEIISIHSNSPALIAQRSDQMLFASNNDSFTTAKLSDGILLPMLDQILSHKVDSQHSESSSLNFYAIHLMGTHPSYEQRYPHSFSRFSPKDLQQNNIDSLPNASKLTPSALTKKTHYLNAIAYNDYVVSEIFKRFEDKNAIVFYFSDHGQEVYDVRDYAGHSTNRFGVEIPFMIYMSASFKQTYPELAQTIKNARHRAFMNDDFIHSLLDVAGIRSKDFEYSRSLFSKHFNASRERKIGNKKYDKDLK